MNIQEAAVLLRQGKKITRPTGSIHGKRVFLVFEQPFTYEYETGLQIMKHSEWSSTVECWEPSLDDLEATDWVEAK